MKFKDVIFYCLAVTLICLFYVGQQIEIVKLSYKLNKTERFLNQTIDRNRVLLYNNSRLKSPKYLASVLDENNVELIFPDTTVVAEVLLFLLFVPFVQFVKFVIQSFSFLVAATPRCRNHRNLWMRRIFLSAKP